MKIKLENIKVKSFITSLEEKDYKTLKGGIPNSRTTEWTSPRSPCSSTETGTMVCGTVDVNCSIANGCEPTVGEYCTQIICN